VDLIFVQYILGLINFEQQDNQCIVKVDFELCLLTSTYLSSPFVCLPSSSTINNNLLNFSYLRGVLDILFRSPFFLIYLLV
jgi:hypothetical protein